MRTRRTGRRASCGRAETPIGGVGVQRPWSAARSRGFGQAQTERVTRRVEYHSKLGRIPVGWLPWGDFAACPYDGSDRQFDVGDRDLEVDHLGGRSNDLWPNGRLVPFLRLESDRRTPGRPAHRDPARTAESTRRLVARHHFPTKELSVEERHLIGVAAVHTDTCPPKRGTSDSCVIVHHNSIALQRTPRPTTPGGLQPAPDRAPGD